jgi:predicted transcriptional regulator
MTDPERLRALLQRYSIYRLSRHTGISRTTLTRIRDGTSSPTLESLGKIWDAIAADAIAVSDAHARQRALLTPQIE